MAYTQEPRNYQIALFFGLYPIYLPVIWGPWQPALELILYKLIMPELFITGMFCGLIAGFIESFGLLLVPGHLIFKSAENEPINYLTLPSVDIVDNSEPNVNSSGARPDPPNN